MLRLSKLADYAMLIMAYLASHPTQVANARSVAEQTGISLPTTSKLLKRLTQKHLLVAHRGIKGGYQLALPASDIPIRHIIHALEGPIALTECSHTQRQCSIEKYCMIRNNWRRISAFIQSTLLHISLADLIQPSQLGFPLKGFLTLNARETT